MLDAVQRDLRHAVRSLIARPTYSLVTVLTLALVIGAGSAVLAVVNATMVRPLPFPESERLVQLYLQPPGTTAVVQRNPLSARMFVRLRERPAGVESLEGIWSGERALADGGEPESVQAARVSAGALPLLGSAPLMGRTWTADEDTANARVVVISHGLWQRRFGGDPAILGRRILIDREPHEIIGVMPREFRLAYVQSDMWTPLQITAAQIESPTTFIQTVARLKRGVSVSDVHHEMAPRVAAIVAEAPATQTGWTGGAWTLREAQFGQQRTPLLVLLAAVAALTLVACANLANLTLAQVMARRGETALRAALGAGRGGVLRLQAIESLMLAAAGGGAGLLIGRWTVPALLALDPQTARLLGDVAIDWRVQWATAAAALSVALLSGILPTLRELRTDLARQVQSAAHRTIGSRRDQRVRTLLVGCQAALTVLLLASGALLLSGFAQTSRLHPGFDPDGVLGAQLRLSDQVYPTTAARAAMIERVLERVRAIPGVESASTTMNRWVPGFAFQTLIHIDGKPTPDGQAHTVQFRRVSPHYFRTLRIPVLRGREFEDADGAKAVAVAVASRSFAEQFWPGEDPIGRRIRRSASQDWLTIVGVVGDVRDVGFGQPPQPTLYTAYAQNNAAISPVSIVLRTTGDPLALGGAVRAAVLSVDPAQPVDRITTLDRFLADSLGPQRFRSTLLVLLAALGLLIAAVGIYGVTSRAVEERTREMGVRLALGAAPGSVWRLVVAHALRAVAFGAVAGLALTAAANNLLVARLAGLENVSAWMVLPGILVLGAAAFIAAAIPARRAIMIDPTRALRQ